MSRARKRRAARRQRERARTGFGSRSGAIGALGGSICKPLNGNGLWASCETQRQATAVLVEPLPRNRFNGKKLQRARKKKIAGIPDALHWAAAVTDEIVGTYRRSRGRALSAVD